MHGLQILANGFIYSTIESTSEFLIDLSNNPNGIYFIKLNAQTNSYYDKIVLQK